MIKGIFNGISALGSYVSHSLNYFYQDKQPAMESKTQNIKRSIPEEKILPNAKRKKTDYDADNTFVSDEINWEELKQYQDLALTALLKLDPFQLFLNRIENAKILRNDALEKLISQQDLLKIYDYFFDKTNQQHLEKIKNLKPGDSYRLAKEDTKLPRTLNILRAQNGEFTLILETKNKIQDNSKRLQPIGILGGFKSGKPAWRIDGVLTEYFNLVMKFDSDDKLAEAKEEVRISQELACEAVNMNFLGQEFQKNGTRKISMYSEKALGALSELVDNDMSSSATIDEQYTLIGDLLTAVKKFHDNNYIHQDIKPDNILFVDNAQQQEYRLKLTDFGISKKQGCMGKALATSGYHSPEIAHIYADPSIGKNYHYFNSESALNSLGAWYAKSMQPITTPDFIAPHKANDMWALGIVIYKMLHGERPPLSDNNPHIENNPLLKGLLAPKRSERIDIDTAIKIHQEMFAKAQKEEEDNDSSVQNRMVI